jgi:PAS domain S-box-containing protein
MRKTGLNLKQQVLLVTIAPLVFELAFIMVLGSLLSNAYQEIERVQRCRGVIALSNEVMRLFYDSGKMIALSTMMHGPETSARLQDLTAQIPEKFDELQKLTANNPHELAAILSARESAKVCLTEMQKAKSQLDSGGLSSLIKLGSGGDERKHMLAHVDVLADRMREISRREAEIVNRSPDSMQRTRAMIAGWLILGVIVNVILAATFAITFARNVLQKLKILLTNTDRLANRQSLLPAIESADELSTVDSSFHAMAAALARLEQRERAIVENALDVICSVRADRTFSSINRACAVWGYSQEDLIGKSFDDTVSDANGKSMFFEAVAALNSGIDCTINHKQGHKLDAVCSAAWSDKDNELFCVFHDVTEKRRVEKLKKELIAMVSHDLRTPLTGILALFELLNTDYYGTLNEKGQKAIGIHNNEAERLIRLITELLDLEKMESGKLELALRRTCLADLVNKSIESVSFMALKKSLDLRTEIQDVELEVDQDRVSQILANLLSNSIKFSAPGKSIVIRSEPSQHSHMVRVVVSDQAGGIPKEKEREVFMRFAQARDEHSAQGHGLGLSIAQTIVELHGGSIGVVNRPGIGCDFWFELPLAMSLRVSI